MTKEERKEYIKARMQLAYLMGDYEESERWANRVKEKQNNHE